MRVPGFKRFFSLSLEASSSEDSLEQVWAISGPRATCGPPQRFQWHAEALRKIFKSKISSNLVLRLTCQRLASISIRRYKSGPRAKLIARPCLERFKSLAKSFRSPWEKSCEDQRDGRKSLSARVLSLSIETSSSSLEREDSSCGKPSKTGTGSSSLCGTGMSAESKFGHVKEFLFFL